MTDRGLSRPLQVCPYSPTNTCIRTHRVLRYTAAPFDLSLDPQVIFVSIYR